MNGMLDISMAHDLCLSATLPMLHRLKSRHSSCCLLPFWCAFTQGSLFFYNRRASKQHPAGGFWLAGVRMKIGAILLVGYGTHFVVQVCSNIDRHSIHNIQQAVIIDVRSPEDFLVGTSKAQSIYPLIRLQKPVF